MKRYTPFCLFFCFLIVGFGDLPVSAPAPEPIKLVFIAGPNDHCGENPCHKYIEDLTLLKECLEALKGETTFDVTLYIGERPAVGTLDEVAAVIVHSSADRKMGEWHALFPQNQDSTGYDDEYYRFLKDFRRADRAGYGVNGTALRYLG